MTLRTGGFPVQSVQRIDTLSDMNSENVTLVPLTLAPSSAHDFAVRLSATRRGARLARYLAMQQLDAWGWPYGSDPSDAVAHLVAELAANAVQHGQVQGRDFRLHLAVTVEGTLRIEVTDAGVDRLPCGSGVPGVSGVSGVSGSDESACGEAESGRGLLLVDALAERWGCDTSDSVSKTVWAEISLP